MAEYKVIEIRGFLTDWREVDRDTAKRHVNFLIDNSLCPHKVIVDHINTKMLRGVTVDELLRE